METKSAAEIVRKNYEMYGKYINLEGRVVLSEGDGLKAVQRRILYSAYRIASNRTVKTATLVGETMGKYHPHGDASIATAVAGLVRDGLLVGVGNFGSTVGLDTIEPAAMRYTECKLDPRILKLAFKYINDVPFFTNDLSFEEPEYIPTPLPLSLCHLNETEEDFVSGIGFGISYTVPKFEVNELFELLKDLVNNKPVKNNVHIRYRSLKVPCSDELFNTGKGTVITTGRYVVNKDKKSFNIIELPIMGKGYSTEKLLAPFDSIPQDFSKDTTNVFIELPRGKTVDDYDLDELLTTKCSVDMYFHDGNVIKHYSLPDILLTTYKYYKAAVLENINKRIGKLKEQIRITELLIKMKPYLNPMNEKTPERVKKALKLDDKTVEELMKYTIKQICLAEKNLQNVKDELTDWTDKKNHLDKFCLDEIENSLRKEK